MYNFQPTNYMEPRPVNGLIRVSGMAGANAFSMPRSSALALFDENEDIFYVKTTDDAGFGTVRAFTFTPVEVKTNQSEYINRQEFNQLMEKIDQMKEMMSNAKQSVPATTANDLAQQSVSANREQQQYSQYGQQREASNEW